MRTTTLKSLEQRGWAIRDAKDDLKRFIATDAGREVWLELNAKKTTC